MVLSVTLFAMLLDYLCFWDKQQYGPGTIYFGKHCFWMGPSICQQFLELVHHPLLCHLFNRRIMASLEMEQDIS
jgi:hypothetical protein